MFDEVMVAKPLESDGVTRSGADKSRVVTHVQPGLAPRLWNPTEARQVRGGGGLDKSSLGLIPRLWNPTGGKTNLRRRTCLTDLDLCAG
jgi:hypothetical protein